ncbi:MAG: patatin-like phospholipase family protein [Pseudomonadota bacterium]
MAWAPATLVAAGIALCGCAALNAPINPSVAAQDPSDVVELAWNENALESDFIVLAFSGGGTRASAFAHGVLQVLDEARTPDGRPLTDLVRVVSGVSGGSVTAAWFGLKGRTGLPSFRERYLIQDVESRLALSPYNPVNLARAIGGGVNDRSTFARFLDESLFEGAKFGDLEITDRQTWINATDIANYTPFVYNRESFRALCSDLGEFPISEAVAASAGFPVAFSPMVLAAHGEDCDYTPPDWLLVAEQNPESTSGLRAYAAALSSYRNSDLVKYVKLLDGGISDNFGTTALSLARASSETKHGPFSPKQAVGIRRGLVLVSNAGRHVHHDWSKTLEGPSGIELAMSIVESSLESATRASFDVLRLSVDQWERDLISWRCLLSREEIRRYGANPATWECADLKIFVGEVGFRLLDPDLRNRMNQVPTRLSLPEAMVDLTISAARQGMERNVAYRGFLQSLQRLEGAISAPVTGGLAAPERQSLSSDG